MTFWLKSHGRRCSKITLSRPCHAANLGRAPPHRSSSGRVRSPFSDRWEIHVVHRHMLIFFRGTGDVQQVGTGSEPCYAGGPRWRGLRHLSKTPACTTRGRSRRLPTVRSTGSRMRMASLAQPQSRPSRCTSTSWTTARRGRLRNPDAMQRPRVGTGNANVHRRSTFRKVVTTFLSALPSGVEPQLSSAIAVSSLPRLRSSTRRRRGGMLRRVPLCRRVVYQRQVLPLRRQHQAQRFASARQVGVGRRSRCAFQLRHLCGALRWSPLKSPGLH